jgi:hypothetical protein
MAFLLIDAITLKPENRTPLILHSIRQWEAWRSSVPDPKRTATDTLYEKRIEMIHSSYAPRDSAAVSERSNQVPPLPLGKGTA